MLRGVRIRLDIGLSEWEFRNFSRVTERDERL